MTTRYRAVRKDGSAWLTPAGFPTTDPNEAATFDGASAAILHVLRSPVQHSAWTWEATEAP